MIWKYIQDECHKKVFSKDQGLINIRDLDQETRAILLWRATITEYSSDNNICLYHQQKLLKKFALNESKCCNPFKKVNHKGTGSLHELTLQMALNLKDIGVSIVPAKKFWPTCRKEIRQLTADGHLNDRDMSCPDEDSTAIEGNIRAERSRESLNSTLLRDYINLSENGKRKILTLVPDSWSV